MNISELNIGHQNKELSIIDGGRSNDLPEDILPDGGRILAVLDEIDQ